MVSVIIPVYNVEKYLSQCVESVINQTYVDLEIILIDDGSPDKCGQLCDVYAGQDDRITVIHKANGGLSEARNVGLSASHGEYIYFLDSDDYIREDAIYKLVDRCEKENAEVVFFDAETIYEGFEDPDYREVFIRKQSYSADIGTKILKALQNNGEYYSCVPLLFFRKDFLERERLFFEKGLMHEDELFTVLVFVRAKRVAQEKEPLYVRRLRTNSIMSERISTKSIDGVVQCIDKMLEEKSRYQNNSGENGVIETAIRFMVDSLLIKYRSLKFGTRKTVKPQMRHVKQALAAVDYFGSRKLRIKMYFPGVYVFYARVLKRR